MTNDTDSDTERDQDKQDGDIGAENEASESSESLPGQPAEDDAPMGDTDQHSSSDA